MKIIRFRSKYLIPVALWVVWFTIQCLISILTTETTPVPLRLGYRYTDIGVSFGLPEWIGVRANFDGVHYMTIAREGYGVLQRAFFPLYPRLLDLASPLFMNNTLLAGVVLSSILSLASVILWFRIFQSLMPQGRAGLSIISLLLFPTAFFLLGVYTESIFVALLGVYVLSMIRGRWWLVALSGVALGLTRLAGVFAISIPLMMCFMLWRRGGRRVLPPMHLVMATLAPILGLVGYMVYLFFQTGDALAFFTVQEQFNNARSTRLILLPQVLWRYFSIIVTARWDIGYVVAVTELLVFLSVTSLLVWGLTGVFTKDYSIKKLGQGEVVSAGLMFFSLANILVPTLTGTLSSIPRYALVGMAVYPLIGSLPPRVRYPLWGISACLQVLLFALFAQGWFVS